MNEDRTGDKGLLVSVDADQQIPSIDVLNLKMYRDQVANLG